jgi:hypothetical protein
VRIAGIVILFVAGTSCVHTPTAGPVGEGSALQPTITAVDTAVPPQHAWINLDRPGSAALVLVAPGHSATVLYPPDSITNNALSAGAHRLSFRIPDPLLETDSMRMAGMRTRDSARVNPRNRTARTRTLPPLPPTTPTFLLLVTSPQPLDYRRLLEKTVGVSIPTIEAEALNAVGKAIKSTIATEPREWAGFFQVIALQRQR